MMKTKLLIVLALFLISTIPAYAAPAGRVQIWCILGIIGPCAAPTPTPTPTLTPTPTRAPTPTPTPTLPPVTPVTKTMIVNSGSGGGVVSAATILNPVAAVARSERLWAIEGYSGVYFPDYDKLQDIYDFDGATPVNTLANIKSPGRYKITGTYDVTSSPCVQVGVPAVVFIDGGDLNIKKDFAGTLNNPPIADLLTARQACKTAGGSQTSLVFIVSGNINIDNDINNIYGIFYAGQTINTASDGASNNRLYVFGSLLADGFSLGRNLVADNTNYPAEQVIYMPQYFLDLGSSDLLGQTKVTWRER